MRRWSLILAALLSFPALAAEVHFDKFIPDGNGGAVAIVRTDGRVLAVPVDRSGAAHPEQTTLVRDHVSFVTGFDIGKTPAGFLTAFNDDGQIGWMLALRGDFSAAGEAMKPLGRERPVRVVCSDDVCAIVRSVNQALLLVDSVGTRLAEVQPIVNLTRIIGLGNGRFAELGINYLDGKKVLSVELIDRAGHVNAHTVVETKDRDFAAADVVPHTLGVAVFWGDDTGIAAAVVRNDGTLAQRAAFTMPDMGPYGAGVVAGGGEYLLLSTTVLEIEPINPTPPFPYPPTRVSKSAAYAMRVSESLNVLEGPTRLAPDAISSATDAGVASGDAFFALFHAPTYRTLRIPFGGPIQASASIPFQLVTPARKRATSP
jgi:hypothetical protein